MGNLGSGHGSGKAAQMSWFQRYIEFNLTGRLVMIASVIMSWRCAKWFMHLEDPTTAQSAFVSVIMGVMTGVYGRYLGKEAKK